MKGRYGALWAGVAGVLYLAAGAVAAQPGMPRHHQGRQGGDGLMPMLGSEQRPMTPREVPVAEAGPRMSPEERRQLRRDVHEAGRDLYSARPPRGRREAGRSEEGAAQ